MFTQVPSSTAAPPATEARSTTMQGAPGAPGEDVPGGTLVVVAYAIVWVVVLLLIVRVFHKQTSVAKRVEELETELKKKR